MKQVILNIPDKKYKFFLELIDSLKFIKIEHEETVPEWHKEMVRNRIKNTTQSEYLSSTDFEKKLEELK